MSHSNIVTFVLAAGKSSRMESSISKVLAPLGGRHLLDYTLEVAAHWSGEAIYCVLSPETARQSSAKQSSNASANTSIIPYHTVIQEEPLGTGHAFSLALSHALKLDPDLLTKTILVLMGDCPLVLPEAIEPMMVALKKDPDVVVMGMTPPDPGAYGRLVVENDQLVAIVEAKDASPEELSNPLCNTGVLLVNAKYAHKMACNLRPSPRSKEYYVTDLVSRNAFCLVVNGCFQSFLGVNTRAQLQEAEALLQDRFRASAVASGAFLMDPKTTFLSYDTQFGRDSFIHPYTFFGPHVRVESHATVHSFSVLSGCHIGQHASVGPFAHIRPQSTLEPHSCVGNFVEIKNTTLHTYAQAKHLSYLGDALIGASTNIGAGVVTCNYDGHTKHSTVIESETLVGSNVSLIAPITIGKRVTLGAGSVISRDVPSEHLAVERNLQKNRPLPDHSKHLQRKKKGEN